MTHHPDTFPGSELLTCPFCGGEAAYSRESAYDFGCHYHWVRCKSCAAVGKKIYQDYHEKADCAAAAKAAWNARTPASSVMEVLDRPEMVEIGMDAANQEAIARERLSTIERWQLEAAIAAIKKQQQEEK